MQEAELQKQVYQAQHEPGLRALIQLVELRRDVALGNLANARGVEELTRWQSAYSEAVNLIKLVRTEPRHIQIGRKITEAYDER